MFFFCVCVYVFFFCVCEAGFTLQDESAFGFLLSFPSHPLNTQSCESIPIFSIRVLHVGFQGFGVASVRVWGLGFFNIEEVKLQGVKRVVWLGRFWVKGSVFEGAGSADSGASEGWVAKSLVNNY